jgi:hypothetical protein
MVCGLASSMSELLLCKLLTSVLYITAYFSVLYHCLLLTSVFYATAYFGVLYHCLLQCSIPLLTSVFYTKVDSEAKTCTGIENVYGLEQCINRHHNWNTLPWIFAFFSVAEMRPSAALIWILQFCQKERPGLEPEGPDQSSPSIIPKRLRARVNWHNS